MTALPATKNDGGNHSDRRKWSNKIRMALVKNIGEVPSTEVRFGGRVQTLKLDALVVDTRFQRPMQKARVDRYVKEFSSQLVGLLTVSARPNGKYVILDGQHRWMVLVERGYTEALCEVLSGLSFQQEAAIFHGRNVGRTRLKPGDYFRARLAANDPIAKAIEEVVSKAGYRVEVNPQVWYGGNSGRSDPKAIVSIAGLERVFGTGLLPQTLSTIAAAWPDQPAFFLKTDLLLGVAAFLRLYPESQEDRVVTMLSKFSPHVIIATANRGAAVGGRGTIWMHVTEDIRSIYNRHARSGHLPPRDVTISVLRGKLKPDKSKNGELKEAPTKGKGKAVKRA